MSKERSRLQHSPDFDVIFEADAGFVTPERSISAYVAEAVKMGALIKTHTPVVTWTQEGEKIRVVTPSDEYTGDKLIITAGPWTSRVLPGLQPKLLVTRQTLAWVTPPEPNRFTMGSFPCWFVEDPDLGTFYGFPLLTSAFPRTNRPEVSTPPSRRRLRTGCDPR